MEQKKENSKNINFYFALGFSKFRSFLLHVVVESGAFQQVRIENTLNKWHGGKIKSSFLDTVSKQG